MRINEKLMKALKFIGAGAAFAVVIPFVSAKASAETVGTFEVTGGTKDTDYTYADGVLTIKTDTAITIKNTNPNTATADKILIDKGASANITLAGVNIEATLGAAFEIAEESDKQITLTLADGTKNTLKAQEYGCAGLQKNGSGSSITINAGQQGTGELFARGGLTAAGIGGGREKSGCKITINGGKITADGNTGGAGIGGGFDGGGSYININGGEVIAVAGGGAGIGGGSYGYGSYITISGGKVNATGSIGGAGIGGGADGYGSYIKISGGEVTATGIYGGAGIGGGDNEFAELIEIACGSVKATADANANAIGGGGGKGSVIPTDGSGNNVYLCEIDNPSGKAITIDGKEYPSAHGTDNKIYAYLTNDFHTVKVGNIEKKVAFNGSEFKEIGTAFIISPNTLVYGTDYTYENGVLKILSDNPITIANADPNTSTNDRIVVEKYVSANITLAGVNIETDAGAALEIAEGIQSKVTVTLADGLKNTLKTTKADCAGLQKNSEHDKITIKAEKGGTGELIAQGGKNGAGIGGGKNGECSYIFIDGGTINATGGENGAGIGGGFYGAGYSINISNGKVNATGGKNGAGIGGGNHGEGFGINITGGEVTANGGNGGAGIGGGEAGIGDGIYIHGGEVIATGSSGGAGIGGGNGEYGRVIHIINGTVTANGSENAAGIGGGSNEFAELIEIACGSVKSTAGANANAIGGGSGKTPVTPTNGKGKNVYLYEIENTNGDEITIDGKSYPSKHGSDNKIYAYLSEGETHKITVGNATKYVKYNNGQFVETTAPAPSKPSRPSRPKPEPVDNPIIGGEEKSWSDVAKDISSLDEGEETTIDLNGATKVPAEVIKAIKDSKAVVTFKAASAFGWTIDGSKLTESDIADVDFNINLITAPGTETLRGTLGTSFAIDNITDKATLNIAFKENHAGKFANLYKTVDGKLVFADNVKIDENGEANGLTVHEKGEYTIMLNELSDRPGDMDNDGVLNAKDALAALKHGVGLETGKNPLVADVNGDGVINANDALAILRMAVSLA